MGENAGEEVSHPLKEEIIKNSGHDAGQPEVVLHVEKERRNTNMPTANPVKKFEKLKKRISDFS